MATTTLAVIGLGANLGDPIQQLLDARSAMIDLSVEQIVYCSHFYLSSPVGYSEQPNFVNAVAAFETTLSAHDLLNQLQQTEISLGRVRDPNNQNAARTIDLDILLYGGIKINDDRLIVPHPRMRQRLFVLAPLAELVADHVFSEKSEVYNLIAEFDLDQNFPDQKIIRLSLQ